ncbi:uncharacterized protein VP01_256g3 [Puccinia sorghi]|uniref:Uncharacterized protein n=1 Tax=Puccinia sorghi TaxID=27349 RepID=A0A0L6V500_9BASI|nr:uncharacterized protein VP01_256g3 [Puccinia sorghi]
MLLFGRILVLVELMVPLLHSSATTTHQDKPAHLQRRYVIRGQPPPPCVHHICPLGQRSQVSADSSYLSVQQSGETNSEAQAKAEPISGSEENTMTCHEGSSPPCSHGQAKRVPTHQSAPITCGDGTKPPCGKAAGKAPHPPDTHQAAPIHCGDGTKPPCGQTDPVAEGPLHCADGTSGPCKPIGLAQKPPTHQTAPITCGDGTKPPCHDHASSPSFPGTHQTAPISCGDGSKPPCHSSPPIPL